MIDALLEGNRRFVREEFARERDHYAGLTGGQKPGVVWIGCSDSRVPVNLITGSRAGEVFVHRNVGNIVATNDWNLSAVLEFSLAHLQIPDLVVCGHYGCGAIQALDRPTREHKYVPIWLINAQAARERVEEDLARRGCTVSDEERLARVVEENVRLQLEHLQEYPFVQQAMRDHGLRLHGWVYDMETGTIQVLQQRGERKRRT